MSSVAITSQRGRLIRENITAYLFLSPALVLIFVFGIFPIGFAFFVSLHRWRRFPEEFVGLDQYVRALGNFAFVMFFWLAVAALIYAGVIGWRFWREQRHALRYFAYFVPGVANAVAILLFINWFAALLPVVLEIPQRIRGQERSGELFLSELAASFQAPSVAAAGTLMLLGIIIAVIISMTCIILIRTAQASTLLTQTSAAALLIGIAIWILQLTFSEMSAAITAAEEAGSDLPIWTQTLIISAGAGLLALAYALWRRASAAQVSGRRQMLMLGAISMLIVVGIILITQLPLLLANADDTMLQGYNITLMYTICTVPLQLMGGLLLAYMLFQKIKLKSFFRVAYFLPYITPFVATAIVFGILFSHRPTSPANQVLEAFGIPAQKWLLEPKGIFTLIFGPQVPPILSGPSLALIVIILYTSWAYIGYATVVYLAGLGNISTDLYEAARIDGASEWSVFRFITLPMLSPTTFFLTLIAIIGTLQSFTQIWILRTPAASSSVDTVGVYIYETISATQPNMGYGSAMALVLFGIILIFTLLQNRLAKNRVFYG